MKKLLLICLIFLLGNQFVNAQLAVGDIAFIGYNTDWGPASNDNFTFICLTDIPGNEVIYFSEEGWDNATNNWAGTTEGHITYTAPASGLSCGTIVSINELVPITFTVTGGGTAIFGSGTNWSLSGGDQVLAYQSLVIEPSTPPTFIAGIHGDDGNGTPIAQDPITKWSDSAVTTLGTARSELPLGLTNGVNCVSLFPVIGTEEDNAKYVGSLIGTAADIRAEINNYLNWDTDNGTAYAITPSDYVANITCSVPNTPPTAVCQNYTAELDAFGNVSITAANVDDGSSDLEGPVTLWLSQTDFDCSNMGDQTVTLLVTDNIGQTASCTATVTVVDNTNPTISCPGNQVESIDANCNFVLPDYTGLASDADNCGSSSITQVPAPGTIVEIGITNIVITATDAFSNSENCNFDVVVEDNINPTIICPGNQVGSIDGSCNFILPDYTAIATATDNCTGAPSVSQVPAPGTIVGIGITNIVLTATDGSNNTANCNFDVVVEDNINPMITCPGNQVEIVDGSCNFVLPDYTAIATATDNCSVVPSVSQVPAPGTIVGIGITNIVLTATDGSNNTANCNFDVVVEDNIAPVITCPTNIMVDNEAGICNAVVNFTPTATDNCSGVVVSSIPASGSIFPIGTTEVTVTATDAAGNTDVCTFEVMVNDTENPVVTCPADIVTDNEAGNCDAVVNFTPTATDNCSGVTVSSVPASGSVFPIGTTEVTVTATDAAGNTDVCIFEVTVNDTEEPVITCAIDETRDVDLGECSYTVVGDEMDAIATDNCTTLTLINDYNGTSSINGENFPVGDTVITWTADDGNGNILACTTTITVEDNEAPEVICPEDQIQFLENGDTVWEVPDFIAIGEATVTDNCTASEMIVITQFPAAGTLLSEGVYTVTMLAKDESGNLSSCTFGLTIEIVLGINDNELGNAISMYPNPANSKVIITNSSNLTLDTAMIYDINGKLISRINLQDMHSEKMVDVSGYSSGIYLVRIIGDKTSIVKQLIKE